MTEKMNLDEIDSFAEQCGLTNWSEWDGGKYQDYFYKFAALAYQAGAKAEREACAQICERISHNPLVNPVASVCAVAIRKQGGAE